MAGPFADVPLGELEEAVEGRRYAGLSSGANGWWKRG